MRKKELPTMKGSLLIGVAVLGLVGLVAADSARAIDYTYYCVGREGYPWHGSYYNMTWGVPVALVVPPTAEAQVQWGWGVGNTYASPICPQFQRNWPGPAAEGQVFRSTPRWPSSTDQFGVYYIRGPW
jgi:hypothetical protein